MNVSEQNHDLSRYHRQMLLPGIGQAGQRRLLNSQVMLVGCGALGCVIGDQLARAGVGHLVIADRDYVEQTNLQRQILFDENDVREALPKAEAARRRLGAINSDVTVTAVVDDIHAGNIERYAVGCDVLLDGTDNFETRYLINDVAVKHGIAYVYGGAVAQVGAAVVILPHSVKGELPWENVEGENLATPDLRDLFETAPSPGTGPTCDTAGVLGSVVSMIGAFQAGEAIKILLGDWKRVCPTMLQVDLGTNAIRQIDMRGAYAESVGICSKQRRFDYLEGRLGSGAEGGVTLCGRHAVQIAGVARGGDGGSGGNGGNGGGMDLEQLADRLRAHGEVRLNRFMLQVVLNGERNEKDDAFEMTVFRDGRAMIKGTVDPARARSVYAKYVGV